MQIAHVLIKCNVEDPPVKELKSIKEISHIEHTFGPYDVVIRLEAESKKIIKQIIQNKIRNVSGIENTLTLVNM